MNADRTIAARQIARAEAALTAWAVVALLLVLAGIALGGLS